MAQKVLPFITHLVNGVHKGAVDIFVQAGSPVQAKIKGHIVDLSDDVKLTPYAIQAYMEDMYVKMANRPKELVTQISDDECSFYIPDVARFRVSVYRQRGTPGAVIRVVSFTVPSYQELNIPERIMDYGSHTSGLLIISGLSCSGKSTTQACLVDRINHTRDAHIITVEEPIEFVHRNDKSFITQREVPLDAADMSVAVHAAMRQSPDVLVLSKLADQDIISKALNTAESGHLVIAIVDASTPVAAIDKLVSAFPHEQRELVLNQLSTTLIADLHEHLVQKADGDLKPEFDVLDATDSIRGMIRENRINGLSNYIEAIR